MSTRKQEQAGQNFHQWHLSKTNFKQQLLCGLLMIGKQPDLSESGFVLPTVAMVSMVVVLLSTSILVRSFDRSRHANNVRVEQAVLNAATPALDRARAKLDALFADSTLLRETPSDLTLYNALNSNRYKLGDEVRLKLVYDINNSGVIQKTPGTTYSLENDETLTTAWKFPIDTDNNSKFDRYTLYSVYFRSPSRGTNGRFNRSRNPLEARMPPMSGGTSSDQCANADPSINLVGNSDWYKTGAKLTKSFFVYTATVPITNPPTDDTNYEAYKGTKGFSALEFQQDRSRIPLVNNAALFQNDLELTPDSTFRLNGNILTNANLLIGGHNSAAIRLYQVSSKNSCFYQEENSKIIVGGNVGTGNVVDTTDQTAITVDLFNGYGNTPDSATVDSSNRSTNSAGGRQVGSNDAAYNKRIALMQQTALSYSVINPPTKTSVSNITQYPAEVKQGFASKLNAPGGSSLNAQDVLAEEIEIYLKDRTRRVPYAEVTNPDGTGALGTYTSANVFAAGIEPPAAWREPIDTNNKLTNTTINLLTAKLPQSQPEHQQQEGKETFLGDRIYVGNNLPSFWKKDGKYVTGPDEKQYLGSNINWTNPDTQSRYRTTQVISLPATKISARNGFWEDAAAQQPLTTFANTGGLRVITGAGIYVTNDRSASFLPPPIMDSGISSPPVFTTSSITTGNANIVVWSDSMPMTGGAGETRKGDLQMRATAVYHYQESLPANTTYINRIPTACVSSYYDPTNATTAKNSLNTWFANFDSNGRSNNGIVYPAPYTTDNDRVAAISTYRTQLNKQARLVFPNGRIVNQPLRDALAKIDDGGVRSLANNSATDTAICAIKILDGTLTPSLIPKLPHGAIKEASFLDARQVKAIDKTATNYDLELEQRQPLEVRVTDIDISQIKAQTIGPSTQQEYFVPNSGIIYASRDDALPDLSDTSADQELLSPTDFKLDSTRRPNGIRLINGSNLARQDPNREEEKGLILVSNLPVYLRADSNNGFNLHQKPGTNVAVEEFTNTLDNDWSDFYTRGAGGDGTLDNNFACRPGQVGCATGTNAGDQWRLTTIFADSITLLSRVFRDGFRNQGDYDLRNNAGTSAMQAYRKNGFFDNSFVTSAFWWDTSNTDNAYPTEKSINSYVGSYLMNGVTPVQRRTDFPEYMMEICRKLPVSECKLNDWVVGYDADSNGTLTNTELNTTAKDIPLTTTPVGALVAGTTARPAGDLTAAVSGNSIPSARLEDQRYARRIAFKRKNNGTLELKEWSGEATPIPLGINSNGKVDEFPYDTYATTAPRLANNALWFRTTANTSGKPYNNPSYNSDKPLAYTGDTQIISPPTLDIRDSSSGNLLVPTLNLPADNPASSYTICTNQSSQGSTTKFFIDDPNDIDLNSCPSQTMAQIAAARQGFLDLAPDASATDNIVKPIQTDASGTVVTGTFTGTTILTSTASAPAQSVVNVIDVDGNFNTSSTCTVIKLVGDENSIFVFRKLSGELSFGGGNSDCGVQVVLDGVDPNNVFWAVNASVKWNAVNPAESKRHKMVGTFIADSTGSPKWETVDFEAGGRLLGLTCVPPSSNFTNTKIYAIAANRQPSLVPVLQIHSPEGSPEHNLEQGSANIQDKWLQAVANDTTFNAVFVSGNSPNRPVEEPADLANFVRFLENWSGRILNIKGSFMQFKRNDYATGPFATVLADKSDDNDGTLSIFDYSFTRYKTENGTPDGTLPYYQEPQRQWSFDVGILSQLPDLFGQKFTQQPVTPLEEFFRQVSRDESWIQTLLCAAHGSGTSYTYAIDASERPATCPSLTSYHD